MTFEIWSLLLMLTSLTFFQTLRFPFLIFSLLELCVSSRNSRNSAIIDGFTFTDNRTYLTCNGCFSISVLPCFGNKVADRGCCIFSSFRSWKCPAATTLLVTIEGYWDLGQDRPPLLYPFLFHRISGPVLGFCLAILSYAARSSITFWKGVLKCIDNFYRVSSTWPVGRKT